MLFLALATACASSRVIPIVTTFNSCPNTRVDVYHANGQRLASLTYGEGPKVIQLDDNPQNQRLNAFAFALNGHTPVGAWWQTFRVDVYQPNYSGSYGITAPQPSSTPNGYTWTFGSENGSCRSVSDGSSGGNSAWGSGGPAWNVIPQARPVVRPAWGTPGPAWE
ncbi:MAG: hypothetical protein JWN89_601 [Parcubacteria group bacterium]|nr:hypothetical protein [Parcubacteria group bacterium]